jgi:hypothetical protein
MATGGSKDTGNRIDAIIPSIIIAKNDIETAMGRFIKNLTILYLSTFFFYIKLYIDNNQAFTLLMTKNFIYLNF